jgi:hypothetical protein
MVLENRLERFQILFASLLLLVSFIAFTSPLWQGPDAVPSKDYSHWPPCFAASRG